MNSAQFDLSQIEGYNNITEIKKGIGFTLYSALHAQTSKARHLVSCTYRHREKFNIEESLVRYAKAQKTFANAFPQLHEIINLPVSGASKRIIASEIPIGMTLRAWSKQKRCNIGDILAVMVKLAIFVKNLHSISYVFRDITPDDILYSPESGMITFSDISPYFKSRHSLIANRLPLSHAALLHKMAPYLAPEQTGSMEIRPGHCSDFYTLGIFFYEILTGSPPFSGTSTAEILHAHMASRPIRPAEKDCRIPVAVSEIVMRLLAKNPEKRYQSAFGLFADLKYCLKQFRERDHIKLFQFGRDDIPEVLSLPTKFYGRQKEIELLQKAFQSTSQGGMSFFLIAGNAGIGKSRLALELKSIVEKTGGFFISGKYDQYLQDMPYNAIIQALREMVIHILRQDTAEIEKWKNRLFSALKGNGKLIIDVIPEIEMLIGEQPAVPHLPPAETRDRFKILFMDFLMAFSRSGHPIVMYLDDLQWIDEASIQFIQMLCASGPNSFFLLGAYRSEEITADHPLKNALNIIERKIPIHTIWLAPFTQEDMQNFVANMVHRQDCQELAAVLLEKTGGNPFFLCRFVESVNTEDLLFYDYSCGRWKWQIDKIQSKPVTNNVIVLLTKTLHKLSPAVTSVLQLAACIGTQFDLQILSAIEKISVDNVRHIISEAEESGFISKMVSETPFRADSIGFSETLFQFQHDSIRQAVVSQLSQNDQKHIHLTIGRSLLATQSGGSEEVVFDSVNQLNAGMELIADDEERLRLCQLNLRAGKKAKASNAYIQAMKYFEIGKVLLPSDSWQSKYELTYELHIEMAESAYLCGDFTIMKDNTDLLLVHTEHLLEKMRVYETEILALIAQNKQLEALNLALSVLRLLGIRLPKSPSRFRILAGLTKIKMRMAGKNIHTILNLPKMTNPYKLAAMRILCKCYPAFFSEPLLYLLIVFQLVLISLRYGNAPESIVGYADLGLILCAIGLIDSGYRYGKLSLTLSKHREFLEYESDVSISYNGFTRHWKEPLALTLPGLLDASGMALKTGKMDVAGGCIFMYGAHALFAGCELNELEKKIRDHHRALIRTNQQFTIQLHAILWQAVLNLIGKSVDPCRLIGEAYNEEEMLPIHVQSEEKVMLWVFHYIKAFLMVCFERYTEALQHMTYLPKYMESVLGSIGIPVFHFYDSLVKLATLSAPLTSQRKKILKTVASNQKKMKKWLHHAPMNYAHRYHIVQAEQYRVLGKYPQAMLDYDKAIALASKNGFMQDAAIANERAALFYLALGKMKLAQIYMQEALAAVYQLGAKAKYDYLRTTYTDILGQSFTKIVPPTVVLPFNFMTILNASQAISKEIMMDDLLKTLLKILMETAGASRILFISALDDFLRIEAKADVKDQQAPQIVSKPITEKSDDVLMFVVHYVMRTAKHVLIHDTQSEKDVLSTRYFLKYSPKSILCLPVVRRSKLMAILYLENNIAVGAFTPSQIEILNVLSAQIAISFENASLYSDLAKNEKELRQSTKRHHELEQIINRSPAIAVLFRNDPSFDIEFISENIRTIGYEPNHFYSGEKRYLDIIHQEDRLRFVDEIANHADEKHPHSFNQEYRIICKDGQLRWVEDHKWSRSDSEDNVTHYQGILIDITDRKRLKDQLSYQLEIEQLIAAISSNFVNLPSGDISHGLDTALSMLAKFIDQDVCILFQVSKDGRSISETNCWYSQEIRNHMKGIPNFLADMFPWLREHFKQNKIIHVFHLSELPAAAECFKTFLHNFDTQAIFFVPMYNSNALIGFLFFLNLNHQDIYNSDYNFMLRTISEIFANACVRMRAAEELTAYQARLRKLSAEVILAEERERRRIAMGMHDGIGHALAFAKIKLKALQNTDETRIEALREIETLINRSIQETRSLTFELSPSTLWDFGLEAAVTWLTRKVAKEHDISISFRENMDPVPLGESQRVLLFQSIRELLFNMVKHAKATHAEIAITYDRYVLQIEIDDNGIGFNPEDLHTVTPEDGGYGLFSIRERLKALGGTFEIDAAPGKGARFLISLPLKNELIHQNHEKELTNFVLNRP